MEILLRCEKYNVGVKTKNIIFVAWNSFVKGFFTALNPAPYTIKNLNYFMKYVVISLHYYPGFKTPG